MEREELKQALRELEEERMEEISDAQREQSHEFLQRRVSGLDARIREVEDGQIILAIMIAACAVMFISGLAIIGKELKADATV